MGWQSAVAANRGLFGDVELEAAKAARTLVVKQLRARTSDIKVLREVRRVLGGDNFVLLVEAITPAEVKSLTKKFNQYRPELKSGRDAWRRSHLCDLANGKLDASAKPSKAPRAKAKPKPKPRQPKMLDLMSMKTPRGRRT